MIEFVAHGIMIDDIVLPNGQTKLGVLGGGGPQTAWGAAAALGSGHAVGIIAGINVNENDDILQPLIKAQINLEGVRHTRLPTPRAWELIEFDGLRRHVWRVPEDTVPAQLERGWTVAPESYHNAKFFHWSMHPGDAKDDIRRAHELMEHGIKVCMEPYMPSNNPLSSDQLGHLIASCKIFSANLYEITKTTGFIDNLDLVRYMRDLGQIILLIRRDKDGADVWDLSRNEGVHVPAVKTNVIDVVGAGNAFTGAFMAYIDKGIITAACAASAAASYMIEQYGMPFTLPNPDEFHKRMREAREGVKHLKL